MTIHFSCPHCQTPLLLPDNCGGQTTRCPSCADTFVIPGSGAAQQATPIAAVLAPVEGQVGEADLQRAKDAFERLTAENVGMQVELARRERVIRQLASRVKWLKRFQAGRQTLDHSVGRIGGFCLSVTFGAVIPIVLLSVLPLSAFGHFVAAVFGMLAAGMLYVPFSFYPDDPRLALLIPPLEEKLTDATRQRDQLAAEEASHREKLSAADTEYQRLKGALSSRLHWLRTCQWQQMTSRNFVNFLKQVFEQHGYTVEATGKKGQVGIDLVLTRDGARVALQAKGAETPIVDNRIVEQTGAGQGMYQCQHPVLVTNGNFMPSAKQLADRLGCKLIDGSQIPDLIEGRIAV